MVARLPALAPQPYGELELEFSAHQLGPAQRTGILVFPVCVYMGIVGCLSDISAAVQRPVVFRSQGPLYGRRPILAERYAFWTVRLVYGNDLGNPGTCARDSGVHRIFYLLPPRDPWEIVEPQARVTQFRPAVRVRPWEKTHYRNSLIS